MRGLGGVEQPAVAAGVDEAREDLGVVRILAREAQQARHRVARAAHLRLVVRVELVRHRQLRVELERPAEALLGLRQVARDVLDVVLGDQPVAAAELGPRRRERGVGVHALPVEIARHGCVRPVAPDLVGAQVELVGAGTRGHPAPRGALAQRERRRQLGDDPLAQLVLQPEHVAHRRLQRLRRDERADGRLHELRRHAQLVARAEQRAGERVVDVGLGGERLQVGRLAREARDRGARADHHGRQPGERGRHGVRQREGQEIDLRVGPQQPERQHREPRERPRDRVPGSAGVVERDRAELLEHRGGRGGPLARPLRERAPDQAIERRHGRVAGERGRLLVQRRRQHLDRVRAEEGGPPRQRLVEDRADREEIRALVGLLPEHLLRRHVAGRADQEAGARQLRTRLDGLRHVRRQPAREPEVEELDSVRGEEGVRRLQVPVQVAGLVQCLERGEHALRERQHLRERERPALEAARQRLALEQLHRDEEVARVLADVVDLADVRVLDARGGARLAPEALARRVVGLGDRLDGDAAAQALVFRREHDAHAALSEPVQDPVAAQPLRVAAGGRSRAAQAVHQAAEQAAAARRAFGTEVRRAVLAVVLVHRGRVGGEYTRPP